MGLDQTAVAVAPGNIIEPKELMSWRKHNALEGWMADLAIKKGLVTRQSDFNCIDLKLTLEDLNQLEHRIKNNELVPTPGFFFGSQDYDPEIYKEEDLDFIKKAKDYIAKGFQIYYSSWW